jgi:hypothetical protein
MLLRNFWHLNPKCFCDIQIFLYLVIKWKQNPPIIYNFISLDGLTSVSNLLRLSLGDYWRKVFYASNLFLFLFLFFIEHRCLFEGRPKKMQKCLGKPMTEWSWHRGEKERAIRHEKEWENEREKKIWNKERDPIK